MSSSSDHIVGSSPAWLAACEDVDLSAELGFDVILHAASGTGKEGMAMRYHETSGRSGSFIAVNCGAIATELFESEFFGHSRGAFTGAASAKDGYFRLAHGGTLFLDEIAELSLKFQVKLLRVLEDRIVRPVGSDTTFKVDVRIVAASHEDLEDLVDAGRFRNDLYWRLRKTDPVVIPSLSDRRDDIPEIAAELLRRTGLDYELGQDALDALSARDYSQGNVRELDSVICSAVKAARRARTKTIASEHITAATRHSPRRPQLHCRLELTRAELRQRLGISDTTIHRWAMDGRIVSLGTRMPYVVVDDEILRSLS